MNDVKFAADQQVWDSRAIFGSMVRRQLPSSNPCEPRSNWSVSSGGGTTLGWLPRFQRRAVAWGVGLALVLSTLGAVVVASERVDRTLPFPSGGTLRLCDFSGDVHITGTAGKDLVIKAVRRAKRDLLDHITLDIRTVGSAVTIDANKRDPSWEHHRGDNVVETSFDIEVPAGAKLDVDVFSSNLDIKGVAGIERLKTFSGSITVDATAAGAVPNVTAKTFSGGIRVRLANSARGKVNFKSYSGRFDTKLPLILRSTGHSQVSAVLPGAVGDGTLKFTTFSGNVHLNE